MDYIVKQPITADYKVLPGPGVYFGGLLLATSGGTATVEVYDGQTAALGTLVGAFRAAASSIDREDHSQGIPFENALFIDLGSNVSAFTVFYKSLARPIPGANPGPDDYRYPGGMMKP